MIYRVDLGNGKTGLMSKKRALYVSKKHGGVVYIDKSELSCASCALFGHPRCQNKSFLQYDICNGWIE